MISAIPFIREGDYPAFYKLASGHPDFPPTYARWLRWHTEYRASELSHWGRVVDVEINPAEFEEWCGGKVANRLALLHFASYKAPQS
jgi:hypothetical protein